jgi:glycosyltransferase involved in cell wall biosynthesis
MFDKITKISRSQADGYKFSIIVPTWNNLPYLQLCMRSIETNSHFRHHLIVMVNEGIDGTLEWIATKENIDYVHSPVNIGICYGLNTCRSMIKTDFLVYVNDDMYMLPGWDMELNREIESIGHKEFFLSSTVIEPVDTGNPCVVVRDYGRNIKEFRESELQAEYQSLVKADWSGSTWPPNIVPVELWDLVGGLSTEFSPGMYSDPDFSKKLWDAGVRYFKGVGTSLAYHFISISTRRLKKNKGSSTFLHKWGMTAGTFKKYYLRSGSIFTGPLTVPEMGPVVRLKNRLKRLYKYFVT